MKGKTLKLACLAGIIFLLCMLPSCSLFDSISGTWSGDISIEVDWGLGYSEEGESDITITISKSGSSITGNVDDADDFETYARYTIIPKEWDLPGTISGTADGKNVTLNFEVETSYVSDSLNYIELMASGTFSNSTVI